MVAFDILIHLCFLDLVHIGELFNNLQVNDHDFAI